MSTDWLPRTVPARISMALSWADEFDRGITGVTSQETTQMRSYYESARMAFDENNSSRRGPLTTANLQTAMRNLVAFMRQVKRDRLDNSRITDAQLVKLGLRPRDATPTPVPAPTSVPEIEAGTAVIRELSFRLRDFGATRWARPAHARGFELVWAIHDARPQHISGLTNTVAATRNPVVVAFDEADRGKRVFFAARWMGHTLQPGPWSDIESAIVP